jgi:hypothetical protein
MERTQQGGLTLTSDEARLVRAALFVVRFHLSHSVKAGVHIYTGHDHAEFVELLSEIDRVREADRRDEVKVNLAERVHELDAMSDAELAQPRQTRNLSGIIREALAAGLPIPQRLRDLDGS